MPPYVILEKQVDRNDSDKDRHIYQDKNIKTDRHIKKGATSRIFLA